MKKILIILLLIPCSLFAQVRHYVSTSGTNSGPGTDSTAAWQTLAYAEANATTAGDTICLKKGNTFNISAVVEINSGGSAGTYITWDGAAWGTGANAILSSVNPVGYNSIVHIAGCDYLKFQNITIEGNDENMYGIAVGGDENNVGPTVQNNEDHIIIRSCTVQNLGDGTTYRIAILVQAMYTNMNNITIDSCTINGVDSHGIAIYANRYTSVTRSCDTVYIGYNNITNCGMYDNPLGHNIFLNNAVNVCTIEHNTITQGSYDADGICLSQNTYEGEVPKNVIIRYNDVRITNQPAVFIDAGYNCSANIYYNLFYVSSMIAYRDAVFIVAYPWVSAVFNLWNNVIICGGNISSSNVLGFYGSGATTAIRNNILVSLGTNVSGNYPFMTSESPTHSNNLYHRTLVGNQGYVSNNGSVVLRDDVDTYEATSVIGDPLFTTNYTNLNLQAGSPAIDEGIGVGLNLDFNGDTVGVNPDIGIQEYGSGPPDIPPDLPTVTTSTPVILYTRYAQGGGNVTDGGGGSVTDRGICWSTSINPTMSNRHVHSGTGTGAFSGLVMDYLTANTTYHVRAFATNPTGTTYGEDVSFTTPIHSVVKTSGKFYKIGNKIVILH